LDARLKTQSHYDWLMLMCVAVLMFFGVVSIWSATGDQTFVFSNLGVKQGFYGVGGVIVLFVVSRIDYRLIQSAVWLFYGAAIVLLIAVLFVGQVIAGSQRWIAIGSFATLQPSEIGKLATMIALGVFIASRGSQMQKFSNFIVSMIIVAVPAGLVYIEPDLGSTLCYGAIWLSMMAVSNTRARYFLLLALSAVPAFFIAWEFVFHDYMRDRLFISYDPYRDPAGEGFNIIQARISIATGGWTGQGIEGGSQSQLDLLRVRTTDFVFSHAAGMFGFVGMVGLLTVFVLLIWRCLSNAEDARDTFSRTFAMGLTGLLFFQAFVNIGMNIGLMPVTGITLPFISYGNTSIWMFLAAIGILQNIRRRQAEIGFRPD
jgi:rod shape determining protein RodA